jgi:hypothetical protein
MTVRVQNQRLMRLRPCRLLCQILGFFLFAGVIIIISIPIIIMHRRVPDETIAGKRFKERPEQRVFRFSHSSIVSDTKFQAEQIGRMAGDRSAGVPGI